MGWKIFVKVYVFYFLFYGMDNNNMIKFYFVEILNLFLYLRILIFGGKNVLSFYFFNLIFKSVFRLLNYKERVRFIYLFKSRIKKYIIF